MTALPLARTPVLPASLQIVAVPSLQSGGMENVGLNTFDASHILACPATATDDDYQNVERECVGEGAMDSNGAVPHCYCICMPATVTANDPPSNP